MAKALITGGTGFVGSHLARALTAAGHTARILRRASSRLDLIADLPIEHAIGDILDVPSLDQAMVGCDWVFHTAAVADYWRAPRENLYIVNVQGTRHILDAAKRAGVKRVILTSSAAAVGLREDGLPSDESVPFNLPPSRFPYGHSKALCEQEALAAVQAGQEVILINPTVVFGPGDINLISGSMVAEFARGVVPPVYPRGSVTAVDVRDVAQAHLAAAERGRPGERYLIGTEDLSYQALFKLIAEIVGVRPPSLPMPAPAVPLIVNGIGLLKRLGAPLPIDANQVWLSARQVCFDSRKARRELGEPQIPIRQSLEDTYQWYHQKGLIKAK